MDEYRTLSLLALYSSTFSPIAGVPNPSGRNTGGRLAAGVTVRRGATLYGAYLTLVVRVVVEEDAAATAIDCCWWWLWLLYCSC